MKNNSKRRSGFTLIEVIISMALIAILSIGVYNSYLMIIKITKDGEVKQMAALAGKKTLENIKLIENFNGKIVLDDKDINFTKDSNDNFSISLKMESDYKICEDQNSEHYSYLENISFEKNKSELNINSSNILLDSIDILKLSNSGQNDKIQYNHDNKENVEYVGKLKIEIFTNNSIKINNSNNIEKEYKMKSSSLKIDNSEYYKDMIISIINYGEPIILYLNTSKNSNFIINKEEGKFITKYDNLDGNSDGFSGILYDIKVEIKDKKDNFLFTGYSTQNISIN